MRNNLERAVAAAVLATICSVAGHSQSRTASRTWELGLGGAVMSLTRTTLSDFRQTQGGDYIFNLDWKMLYGGLDFYSSMELNGKWSADLQGTLGLARYRGTEGMRQGYSLMVGPGVRFRPFPGSGRFQPYLRLGLNLCHKNFPTSYFGQFAGDVTKEALWRAEDSWNRGYTFDTDTFFPVSAGIGIVCWMNERIGVHVQWQYNRSIGTDGVNFVQTSAGIVLRLGGADRGKAFTDCHTPSRNYRNQQ